MSREARDQDDYLWDGSGAPDPEVQRLEALLRPLRHQDRRPRRWTPWLAGAGIAAALALGWYWWPERRWIETREPVELAIQGVGRLNISAASRIRMEKAGPGEHRFRLERGRVEAFIYAPPRRFFIDTPAAVAVDLGCAYTLEVSESGRARVQVRAGWVAFEHQGQEAFIPAGAECRTATAIGLGIPVYQDADPALKAAVARFEENGGFAVPVLVRPRDHLTLWHWLRRAGPGQRRELAARLTPSGAEQDALARGDRAAIDAAWNRLGIGDSRFWRGWKQPL